MLVVSAADGRFKLFAHQLARRCRLLGYRTKIYDLGGLGFGEHFTVTDRCFVENGWYNVAHPEIQWMTRALHKPAVVRDALAAGEDVTYLDADALPVARFDEVWDAPFDICLTARGEDEHTPRLGRINAGVMFFRNSPTGVDAVRRWGAETAAVGNDQLGLSRIGGTTTVPTRIYNYYYFPDKPPAGVKILHFKGEKRRLYFDYMAHM
jgi:hypothetical protein